MSTGVVIQILVNLIFLAGFTVTWLRLSKPPKDDPRLSRGLQLLQQKIAVLEDLGDQTERQVQQITQLIDAKGREIQNQISVADDQIRKIENMMGKSMEVANIFQDRIPHEEIIDRKATMKYVKAARLAHQGQSIEQISDQVDLSRAEIEFVAKVNRNQLQFSEEDLPAWAKDSAPVDELIMESSKPTLKASELPAKASLSQLGDKFRQATHGTLEGTTSSEDAPKSAAVKFVVHANKPELAKAGLAGKSEPAAATQSAPPAQAAATRPAAPPSTLAAQQAKPAAPKSLRPEGPDVKKVVFPRVDDIQKMELKKLIDRNLG